MQTPLFAFVKCFITNSFFGKLSVLLRPRSNRLRSIFFIGVSITSCSSPQPGDKLANLSFGDFETDALRKNRIARTLVKYHSVENSQTDTVYYDSLGRKSYEVTAVSSVRISYGTNGLVLTKTFNDRSQHPVVDSATYTFVEDSLMLYQSWLYDSNSYRYLFDEEGKVIEELAYKAGNVNEKNRVLRFSYDRGLLTKIDAFIYVVGTAKLVVTSTFYYTGEKLDSLVQHSPVQKTIKRVYDSNGLVVGEYYDAVLIISYVHERRE